MDDRHDDEVRIEGRELLKVWARTVADADRVDGLGLIRELKLHISSCDGSDAQLDERVHGVMGEGRDARGGGLECDQAAQVVAEFDRLPVSEVSQCEREDKSNKEASGHVRLRC